MEIIKVSGRDTIKAFHRVPEVLYRNDPNYIPLMHGMVEDIFNPSKNSKFKQGDACRWILKREHKLVGRIAAFYDKDYASGYDQPTGCCGFFECIDDQEAASLLFDTARIWLKENGMEAMDGPVNFGENLFNWGLLSDRFESTTFGMPYNPPYYRKLFETYGFRTFYEQFSYALDITNPDLPDRFWKIAAWVARKPGFTFRHFSFKEEDKLIRDFIEIHWKAWSGHSNYKPADFSQVKALINQSKFLLDEEFIWYVYHHDEPVAFYMMIPDANQILQRLKSGKLNLINMIKLIWYKRKKVISRCRVIVLGVIPKYQRLGLESGIFYRLKQVMLRKPWYKDMEMSWIADFNPKMIALFKSFGAEKTFTHLTLRYLFDRNKEFKRADIIS